MTVWKFPVRAHGVVTMPLGATVVHVHAQDEAIYLWAVVDPTRPTQARHFRIYNTGHELAGGETYVGTVHQPPYVGHVFEVTK